MDTRAVADELCTDTKTLRRFLRSSASSITPVGSGGRYAFTREQVDVIRDEFKAWSAATPERPAVNLPKPQRGGRRAARTQEDRDAVVWAEEGVVVLPDIRRPEVLRAVRAQAAARDARLTERLMAAGLHITQIRDRVPV